MVRRRLTLCGLSFLAVCSIQAAENVMITGVPDYAWHAGCFGTASGNLMGYWDRHGFPNFYTGPTGDGLAPLSSAGVNVGIRSLWASRAGFDGRPADQPGHVDDYWTYLETDQSYSYESTEPDPYVTAGRVEHEPDSLCDFMGASQNKWADLDGECSGNIDAYSFNFWDKSGSVRTNFVPAAQEGQEVRDVQSGIRKWTQYRGYHANLLSQLADFNPTVPAGHGFTFEDLRAEILRGNPVLLMLQNPGEYARALPGNSRANPNIHAMVAFHFVITDNGDQLVQFRTSWASGDQSESWAPWGAQQWAAGLALRGVILFRPSPKVTDIERNDGELSIKWDGPSSTLWDDVNQVETPAHGYILESSSSIDGPFTRVGDPTFERELKIKDPGADHLFFRVRLFYPAYDGVPTN
jgi:hypothetical protein